LRTEDAALTLCTLFDIAALMSNSADQYRVLAAQCDARAARETDGPMKAEWEAMGKSYRRLAEQADRNAQTDITCETPRPNKD
jgi:hypothetical protein